MKTLLTLVLVTGFLGAGFAQEPWCVPEAKNGIVVIEAESQTDSPWKLLTEHEGYTGTGYLVMHGANHFGDPPQEGRLTYKFTVPEAGAYEFEFHTWSEDSRMGEGNDIWLKINNSNFVKMGSHGSVQKWGWGSWSEGALYKRGALNQTPKFNLTKGENTLIMAPRSEDFCIDRFVLFNVDENNAKNLSLTMCENSMLVPRPRELGAALGKKPYEGVVHLFSPSGALIGMSRLEEGKLNLTDLPPGAYFIKPLSGDAQRINIWQP